MNPLAPLRDAWRRTGADLPWGDPRPSHGAEMEGYYWRFTDPASGRVVVALCGVNRAPAGRWATVALAVHPEGIVRSAAVPMASDDPARLRVRAGAALRADGDHLRAALDPLVLDVTVEPEPWPLVLPGGGVAGVVPLLGQYWHPHVLRGRARGWVEVEGERVRLDGATAYAEKNWGRGFPERWWWGQADAFDRPDVAVAFGGGALTAGPVGVDVTGVVAAVGSHLVRLAPPLALVRCTLGDGTWDVRARSARTEVVIEGDGTGSEPAVLPVPLPAEVRNVDTDLQHLAARMHLVVRHDRRLLADTTTDLAALEVGTRPA